MICGLIFFCEVLNHYCSLPPMATIFLTLALRLSQTLTTPMNFTQTLNHALILTLILNLIPPKNHHLLFLNCITSLIYLVSQILGNIFFTTTKAIKLILLIKFLLFFLKHFHWLIKLLELTILKLRIDFQLLFQSNKEYKFYPK